MAMVQRVPLPIETNKVVKHLLICLQMSFRNGMHKEICEKETTHFLSWLTGGQQVAKQKLTYEGELMQPLIAPGYKPKMELFDF